MGECCDVIIVGAGITGCAIARELSRYRLDVAVVDKFYDVASGTSKANSGIVHAGFDSKESSLHAHLNMDGVRMYPNLCRELGVEYRETGSLVVAFDDEERETLRHLLARGLVNGVMGLELVDVNRLTKLEPMVSSQAVEALWAPYSGVVSPYKLTIALAESAAENGVRFHLGKGVTGIVKRTDGFIELTLDADGTSSQMSARAVINAAGVYADVIAALVGDEIGIEPVKGQEAILDKRVGDLVRHVLFPVPTPISKGMLVSPTADGNLLIGPTAEPMSDKEDKTTTSSGLASILAAAKRLVPAITDRHVITSYAGIRANPVSGDFTIGHSAAMPGVIHAAGIKSPGLTAAPAIAMMVTGLVKDIITTTRPNDNFKPRRDVHKPFRDMTAQERQTAISANSMYGRVVCRCETVTEAEIIEAIHSPVPADNLDALKRRTRAGMGRCQGAFCGLRLSQLLSRELGIPLEKVTKSGGATWLYSGPTKGSYGEDR